MLGLAAALALAAAPARAQGAADVDRLYFHRDQGGNLEKSIAAADALIGAGAADPGALLWRRCRSLVRRGERRATKTEKLDDYELARRDCEGAVAASSSSADAHFWLGVALGRWGETNGVLKALFLVKPIREQMRTVLSLDPGHGGAHHVLGEMLWRIPSFAGGSKTKALTEFEAAVRLSPDHTANYRPLAEAYLHFGRADDAVRVLQAVEAVKTPADPAEYPENLADARRLLGTLGDGARAP